MPTKFNCKAPFRKAAQGVTLLEVVTTLGIVGVLMGIGFPSFSEAIERNRTATVANRLLADLARTRSEAISFHVPAVLCPSTDGSSCRAGTDFSEGWLAFRDQDADGRLDPNERVIAMAQASDLRYRRLSTSSGRSVIRFRADGRNAGTNLTLRLCDAQGAPQRLIILNVGGRARIARATPATPACPG